MFPKGGFAVVDRRSHRSLLARAAALLGAVLLLALALDGYAQDGPIEDWTTDNISEPIQINANNISVWSAAGKQILLLQGGAVVSQGTNMVRATDGVVWVDMSRFQTDKVMALIIYGENPLNLERNKGTRQAGFGYVRLATTNQKIVIKAFKSEVAKADRSSDPVYQRAAAGLEASGRPPVDPNLRQAGYQQQPMVTLPPEPKAPAGGIPPPPDFGPLPPPPSPPPPPTSPTSADAAVVKPPPRISVRGRYFGDLQVQYKKVENDWTAAIVTGGVALIVTQNDGKGKLNTLDMEADRAVIWTKGEGPQLVSNTRAEQEADQNAYEIYLAGNVELRTRSKNEVETLRADQVYYDVRRGVAVARKVDLEIQSARISRPLHVTGDELQQINPKLYKLSRASTFSSALPSDPGLTVNIKDLNIEEVQKERTYLYFFPAYDKDGKRIVDTKRYFTGRHYVPELEGVPFFYLPYYHGDVERPLGPLDGVSAGYNKILGGQIYTTWDVFDLLNLTKPEGHRWRLMLDEMTTRGFGYGTEYDFEGINFFGIHSKYTGMIRLYGLTDHGTDVLGGGRGTETFWPDQFTVWPVDHPAFRGQAFGKVNVQELPDGFSVVGQFSYLSDPNFLEQYYLNTFLNDNNQETFLYVKQQENNWAWSVQGQVNARPWLTETAWLPKADGYLLGQTFLEDHIVYDVKASAGYGQLRPADQVPFAYLPTDVRASTVRLDLNQDVSLPFYLGPFKVAPYALLDLSYYSEDVNGNPIGRIYGGGGVRWNMPLSRLYPNIESELLNLNGIYHKVNFNGNYFNGATNVGVNTLPQLDRLNDDVSDQSLRFIRPLQSLYNPGNATALVFAPWFNPQNYAIRRLVDNTVDTLDNMEVFQLSIDQRWQTKRGFPGNEHVIDWMSLNVGVSIFPHSQRDNFGHTFGILTYDWLWNVGDRTALYSTGWFEPFIDGPRVIDVGGVIGRPDTTSLTLGYRQIDPLNSKAVVASVIYPFSAKYAMTASTVWDFGNHISSYSIFMSRMGSDVMVNFGFSFSSTLNTFSFVFEMVPSITRPPGGAAAALFPVVPMNIDQMINKR
jgi:hypothetical protein